MTKLNELWSDHRWNRQPNLNFCRVSIYDGTSRNFCQCSRKAMIFRCVEGQDVGFCRQHDPEVVAVRNAARNAAWKAESDARNARYDRERREREAVAACRGAMQLIADGHNDPRALAAETLALFPNPAKATERLEERG